jgi:hypothetical protein
MNAARHVGGAIGADIPEVLLVSPQAVAEMGLDPSRDLKAVFPSATRSPAGYSRN